jgi:hypothetical protein
MLQDSLFSSYFVACSHPQSVTIYVNHPRNNLPTKILSNINMRFSLPVLALTAAASVSAADFYAAYFPTSDCSGDNNGANIYHDGTCVNKAVAGSGSIQLFGDSSSIAGWTGADCTGDIVIRASGWTCAALTGTAVASWSTV